MPEENLIPQRLKDMPGSGWGQPAVKEFVPKPPPTEIPEREQKEVKIPEFLDPDLLSQLDTSGWYQGTTGKPQTFEEQQFVVDYLGKYGMLPVAGEAPSELQTEGTYDPESTMGRLGFGTRADYDLAESAGERYGPYAGADVPFNTGIVVTDEFGNPTGRYMDMEHPEARRAIAEGRYINPIVGPMAEQFGGGLPGGEGYYNQPMQPFERPSIEEALGRLAPETVYKARLTDYLDRVLEQDAPAVQEIEDITANVKTKYDRQLALGEIDKVRHAQLLYERQDYEDRALAQLMTEEKYKEIAIKAVDLIGKGTSADQLTQLLFGTDYEYNLQDVNEKMVADLNKALVEGGTVTPELPNYPTLSDIEGTEGASVMDLYNTMLSDIEQEYKRQQAEQPPPWTGYSKQREVKPQQSEASLQSSFLSYAEGLDITPEYQNWLKGQYGSLKALWLQSEKFQDEKTDFIAWLNQYLAGG